MAKFYGKVGYGESVETPSGSGKWVLQITELPYYGDVLRNSRKLEDGEGLNKNVTVGNRISIVADEFAVKHYSKIKYIWWNGVTWTVPSVEVQAPRLIFTLGDVYNGPKLAPAP